MGNSADTGQGGSADQERSADPSAWDDDAIQFPRLITEIVATQDLDMLALCESMDLGPDDLDELFERAEQAWQIIKRETHDAS